MKVKLFIIFFILVANRSHLFSQSVDDSQLIRALNYSNVKHTSEELRDDIGWIIQLIYKDSYIDYQNALGASVLKRIDDENIYLCIKNNITANTLNNFIIEYNAFHETESYKHIDELERREISESEKSLYSFEKELPERKVILTRLITMFDFNKYQLIYMNGLSLLIIDTDANIQMNEKEALYFALKDYLHQLFINTDYYNDNLNYYSACYHDLSTEELGVYVDYFSRKEVNQFYNSIYEGLSSGLTINVNMRTIKEL
jgi:hypothetical protein